VQQCWSVLAFGPHCSAAVLAVLAFGPHCIAAVLASAA